MCNLSWEFIAYNHKLCVPLNCEHTQLSLYWFVWAAVTKWQRLGGLNDTHLFLAVMET